LRKEETQLSSQESKYQEELCLLKRDKQFLDLLAISANTEKKIQVKGMRDKPQQPTKKDSTFMTSLAPQPKKGSMNAKSGKAID
jgi:hypothetical protein